jgi:predicted ATPase/DNA-binding SARP family transcriptional activator
VDFRLLGPLQVSSDGRMLELRAKERTLLAVLLLHANETVSSERLIDELWGPRPPASAAKLLATYVWQLRKALGETIVTRSPGYAAVVAPDRLDTTRFDALLAQAQTEEPAGASETLRAALALWRGPALIDVTFESSAREDVARLDDQRLSALERRIDHDLALGRHERVLAELQELVGAHPFRERYRGQLMVALYRSGRQAEALETYRDARRRFVDELGIEPGPELQRLERSILAHDQSLDSPATPGGRAAVKPDPRSASGTNLPRPLSSFVGRERELRDLLTNLRDGARLLTLTGPGGSGKTRLALEAARAVAPELDGDVFWVGLAPLRDPSLVLATIADTVGARDDLPDHIGEREMLLLVDNLEHVIEAAAELASLLAECPNLRLLVTSRERMRVLGELEYPVPPLLGPDAVSLFSKRAQVEPSPEIEALCSRLDNLPLAVELAAARAKALSPAQILERLSQRLDLFQGARDADPRQRTLRATIEWSHDLLTLEERRLLARLGVFAGGCTFDAAAQVCDADLETLQALVERNLVRFSGERYRMLETIREFAAERLSEYGELDSMMERLAGYLVDLANEEGAPLFLGRAAEAYTRLELEHANVRAVVEWAIATKRYEHVAGLAVVLHDKWESRNSFVEVARWTEHALRARGSVADELWPHVLLAAERVRLRAGDRARARALLEEALQVLQHLDPQPYLEAICLSELSMISLEEGHLNESRRLAERSLELRLAHDLVTARALHDLGHIAVIAGDLGAARRFFEEARAPSQGTEFNVAYATRMLAELARRRGEYDEAAMLLDEALHGFAKLGDVDAVAACLKDLAVLAKERGELERAARLWSVGTALAQRERQGSDRLLFPQEIGDLPELEAEVHEPTLEDALALARPRSGS